MTEEAPTQSQGGSQSDQGLKIRVERKANFNPGTRMVGTALHIFVNDLAKRRRLIEIADKDRKDAVAAMLKPNARRLEIRERIAIETRMSGLEKSRKDRFFEKLDDGATKKPSPEDKHGRLYPMATEQYLAVVSLHMDEVESDIRREIQEAYKENSVARAYAQIYYTTLSQPNLSETLAKSLLPSTVYEFETFLGALVRSALFLRGPLSLGDLPPVPFDVIQSYGQNVATKDLERWAIDRRVENFVRGGYDEWRVRLEQWCNIELDAVGNWKIVREAFARTRLLARSTGGRVDAEYVAEVEAEDVDDMLWEKIETSPAYYDSLSDEFELAAMCLSLRWAQYFFPDPEADVNLCIERLVEFQNRGRWQHSLRVAETLLDTYVHRDHPEFGLVSINLWLCRQELGTEDDELRRSIANFRPRDLWEKIGHAAIRRDWPDLASAITEYGNHRQGSIDPFLRFMPIMRRSVKEHPDLAVVLGEASRANRRRGSRGNRRRARK